MLIGNRTVLLKSPGRYRAGNYVAGIRSNYNNTSSSRAMYGHFDSRSAIPSGANPPESWVLPIKSGVMASRNATNGSADVFGSGAMGVNAEGLSEGTSILEAIGELVASLTGNAYGSSEVTGNLLAVLIAQGLSEGSSTATATIGAIASLIGNAYGSSTGSLVPYATGELIGTTEVVSELNPATIANAVWDNASGVAILKLLKNRIVRSGNTIVIYNDDGSVWKQYDLSDGGRVEV